jgi:hypothetical protein
MNMAELNARDPLDLRPCECANSSASTGRFGDERGRSWCISCGGLLMEAHTEPCSACRHFTPDRLFGRTGICGAKLMGVTADMRVTYYVRPDPRAGRHGLCFEAAGAKSRHSPGPTDPDSPQPQAA